MCSANFAGGFLSTNSLVESQRQVGTNVISQGVLKNFISSFEILITYKHQESF